MMVAGITRGGTPMKIRNLVTHHEYEAELSSTHSASSYGQLVLMDKSTGEPIGKFSFLASKIIQATEEERQALKDAGYFSKE
jgi:hypothetical protein